MGGNLEKDRSTGRGKGPTSVSNSPSRAYSGRKTLVEAIKHPVVIGPVAIERWPGR